MRNMIILLTFMSLPMLSAAFDLHKFALTSDINMNWNASGFNDAYRLYTFRKDGEGNRREFRSLSTFGFAYRHVTKGGILVQPSLSFGDYGLNKNRKNGLASSLLISQYTFKTVQRYMSLSAFQSFGKGQNTFLKSTNVGLLFAITTRSKGDTYRGAEVGIGFSLMHIDGSFIPGINLKANSWRL